MPTLDFPITVTLLEVCMTVFRGCHDADGAALLRLARRRPDCVGTDVPRVELQSGRGSCLADTGSRGHWSIWGIPDQLAGCVVDVMPVHR